MECFNNMMFIASLCWHDIYINASGLRNRNVSVIFVTVAVVITFHFPLCCHCLDGA